MYVKGMEDSLSGNDVKVTFDPSGALTGVSIRCSHDVDARLGVDGALGVVRRGDIDWRLAVDGVIWGNEGFGVERRVDGDG